MARGRPSSLSAMSVDALLTLREEVGRMLSQRTSQLRAQLQRLEFGGARSSPARTGSAGSLKGRKLPPKYRDPDEPSNVWAGRGALPHWMQEKISAGAKRDDFLVGASGPSSRKKRSKKRARKAAKPKVRAKTKRKSRKQATKKAKVARTASRKRRSAAQLPHAAPTPAAPTEGGS